MTCEIFYLYDEDVKNVKEAITKKKTEPEYQKPKVKVQVMSMKALLGENGWGQDGRKLLAVEIT